MIFSIKPQIFELKCVFSYFRLKTHITLLLPVYVHSWEQRKFSDLVQIERGGSPRPIDDFITDSPDGLNWVKIGDAPAQGNYITKTAEKIKPEGLSKTREVHPGDLILSNSMSFGKPYIMGIDGCIHDGWLLIRNTYKVFDLTFLCHLLGTPQMIIQYKSLAAGSTVNNLNKELVGNTVVTIPTIKEQRVLGQYLETLDNLITLHQCKCQIDGCRFQSPLAITWEQRKLSEIATMHARIGWQNLRTSEFLDSGDYMLITGTDFIDGAVNFDTCHYVERERYEQDKHIQIRNGSILITKDGTLGKVAYIQGLTMPATLNAGVFNVEIKDENEVDNRYLFQYLKAPFLMDYVDKKATGGTIKHLNQNILVDFPVVLPHKAEQEKIGEYFLAIDHLITLHQRKYDKLTNVKKSMLEKMFPQNGSNVPEIRFKGFTEAWEQRKLGEIGSVSMCRRIFKEQTSENGEIPFYKIGTFGGEADAFISRELFEEYKAKYQYPKKGDILISASGSIGRTVVFTGKNEYFQDSNIVWLNHDKHLDNSFLKCFYSIVKWAGIEGSTIKRLYNDNILNTTITLPSVEEQQKIGAYFENLDNLITLHQRELEKLKNLKKACLEKMFV